MRRILSGIQPSGKLHIGNYLGAIKKWIELQNCPNNKCFFFIADYHSMTENYDPKEKPKEILGLAIDLLALGLDPKKSVIFQQSQIPAHTDLAWIFNTITPMGELERMTQFKDKTKSFNVDIQDEMLIQNEQPLTPYEVSQEKERRKKIANIGLFTYPVLMAADILIYKAEAVPVGEDQTQHLELTRTIARKFNDKFGETFPEPESILTETPRIMSLTDPAKKMSKSGGEKSYIALTDSPETIIEKIKSATSDAGGNIENKFLGGGNLLSIFKAFVETEKEKEEYEKFKKDHEAIKLKYSELKPRLAELISNYFADFRRKRAELSENPDFVKKILEDGNKKASAIAEKTLQEAKQKIGLII